MGFSCGGETKFMVNLVQSDERSRKFKDPFMKKAIFEALCKLYVDIAPSLDYFSLSLFGMLVRIFFSLNGGFEYFSKSFLGRQFQDGQDLCQLGVSFHYYM